MINQFDLLDCYYTSFNFESDKKMSIDKKGCH